MMRMWNAVRYSSFLRQNAVFFLGSVAVGALNYAYYPILGRLLSVQAYGEVQALMSLFFQLLIFLAVLGQVTVNVVANYDDEGQKQKVVYELEKLALFVSVVLFVVVAVFGWKLKSFFHFTSVWPFTVLMLAIVATVPLAFRNAYLRGHKKFLTVSVASLLSSVVDIVASVMLVWVGWSTIGAMFGIAIAQFLAFLYAARAARRVGFMRPVGATFSSLPDIKALRPELKYALLVLCGSLIVTVLSSVDIFVAKHYFSATDAGEYAGISTVARIVFFLTASVAQVLLPSVRLRQTPRHNRLLFLKSLALVLLLGGVTTLVFSVFSTPIIKILMGGHYLTDAGLLGRLSLAMLVISVLNLIISYNVALRRFQISGIVILGAIVTGYLLATFHGTLETVVNSLLYGSLAMLGMFAAWWLGTLVDKRVRS